MDKMASRIISVKHFGQAEAVPKVVISLQLPFLPQERDGAILLWIDPTALFKSSIPGCLQPQHWKKSCLATGPIFLLHVLIEWDEAQSVPCLDLHGSLEISTTSVVFSSDCCILHPNPRMLLLRAGTSKRGGAGALFCKVPYLVT